MDVSDLVLPGIALVLVTALALFAATRRSEPAGRPQVVGAALLTALVAGWLLAVPVLALTGGPLPAGGGAGYLTVLALRAVAVVALWVAFWRVRTMRAFSVAGMVTLAMALPELGWVLNG